MLLTILYLFIVLIALAVGLAVRLYFQRRHRSFTLPIFLTVSAIVLAIIFGGIFTPLATARFNTALAKTHWPKVEGKIIHSEIVGERAFRPDLRYVYAVSGDTLTGASNLDVPGFGGRMNRLDAAEKLVRLYPVGKTVTVYVNPNNQADSTLHPFPRYAHYLEMGTSALLALIGLSVLCIHVFRARKN